MAFISVIIMWIVATILATVCLVALFLMVLFLILGILMAKKGKASAKVFFILSGSIFMILVTLLAWMIG